MRLLADQDVYKITTDKVREWGHDLLTAKELGLQRAPDEDLLRRAKTENRLLLTRDKGFGGMVFLENQEVHRELHRLLEEHTEDELRGAFSVVESHRHRIRRL